MPADPAAVGADERRDGGGGAGAALQLGDAGGLGAAGAGGPRAVSEVVMAARNRVISRVPRMAKPTLAP
jgi:hypothetical protein